jgi:hypothetical protein
MAYQWLSSENIGNIEPQIAYVEQFKQWGWVVGMITDARDIKSNISKITNGFIL